MLQGGPYGAVLNSGIGRHAEVLCCDALGALALQGMTGLTPYGMGIHCNAALHTVGIAAALGCTL